MKKYVFALISFLSFVDTSHAQFELRINPLHAFIIKPYILTEFHMAPVFSLELQGGSDIGIEYDPLGSNDIITKSQAYKLRLSAKYYYSSYFDNEGWYSGFYTSFQEGKSERVITFSSLAEPDGCYEIFSCGILTGYKWFWENGFVLEGNVNLGRSLAGSRTTTTTPMMTEKVNEFEFFSSITLGYRFSRNKEEN